METVDRTAKGVWNNFVAYNLISLDWPMNIKRQKC